MFKKENLMTTIVIFVVLAVIGLGIFGSVKKNEGAVEEETVPFVMEDQPLIGKADAKSQLAIYFDYSCSHCAEWELTMLDQVQELIKEDKDVSLRFVNYQFMSQASVLAGVGGEIVQELAPENFVNYTKGIYSLQHGETKKNLTEKIVVEKIMENVKGKTEQQIKDLLKEEKYEARVISDREYGNKVGVTGTPTMILNNQTIVPAFDIQGIKDAIKDSREEKKEKKE